MLRYNSLAKEAFIELKHLKELCTDEEKLKLDFSDIVYPEYGIYEQLTNSFDRCMQLLELSAKDFYNNIYIDNKSNVKRVKIRKKENLYSFKLYNYSAIEVFITHPKIDTNKNQAMLDYLRNNKSDKELKIALNINH